MKSSVLIISCLLACALPLGADMGTAPKTVLTQGVSDMWDLTWNGRDEITYFGQWSTDLSTWSWFPGLEHGDGVRFFSFNSSTSKFFVRLHYTNIPTTDAELADFDNDGLGNLAEVTGGTSPMNPDSDFDGVKDGIDPLPLSSTDGDILNAADDDGDGLNNAQEKIAGTSPTLWDSDGDGVGDSADAFPLDPTRSSYGPPTVGDSSKPTVTLQSPINAILVSGP
jgi:hypothetical protein